MFILLYKIVIKIDIVVTYYVLVMSIVWVFLCLYLEIVLKVLNLVYSM